MTPVRGHPPGRLYLVIHQFACTWLSTRTPVLGHPSLRLYLVIHQYAYTWVIYPTSVVDYPRVHQQLTIHQYICTCHPPVHLYFVIHQYICVVWYISTTITWLPLMRMLNNSSIKPTIEYQAVTAGEYKVLGRFNKWPAVPLNGRSRARAFGTPTPPSTPLT